MRAIPWFKVDDGFHGHPKVIGLSASAVGLWLLAGTWSAQYLTDGHVPRRMVTRFGGTDADAGELLDVGLWHDEDGGFRFHEWEKYQPMKEHVEAERAAARERMQAVRAKRKGATANTEGSSDDVHPNTSERSTEVRLTPTQPSPSQPEPSKEGSVARKRGTRIPDPFVVTAEMRAWASDRTPLVDVNTATERFVNHWRAKAGRDATKLDWIATWRNWLIRDQDDRQNRKLTPTERAAQTVAAGRQVLGRQITSLEIER